jgi:hypothetical protein
VLGPAREKTSSSIVGPGHKSEALDREVLGLKTLPRGRIVNDLGTLRRRPTHREGER